MSSQLVLAMEALLASRPVAGELALPFVDTLVFREVRALREGFAAVRADKRLLLGVCTFVHCWCNWSVGTRA